VYFISSNSHFFSGDDTYLVPEDSRAEAPPSYAHAQGRLVSNIIHINADILSADAVPPYWETTVHAPFSSEALGEMIVDSL
jgi:hypothetical protein